MERAFPLEDRPDYIVSPDFCKFTPTEEFMSIPGDIARTQFRLVVTHEGWEYVVLEREMGVDQDPARSMLVTVSHHASFVIRHSIHHSDVVVRLMQVSMQQDVWSVAAVVCTANADELHPSTPASASVILA